MPVVQPLYSEAPDNPERTALRDAFPQQGRVRIVDVAAAAGVTSIDMRAIGLTGRHVRITVSGGFPLAYLFEAPIAPTPPATSNQTTPDSTARATFGVLGNQTASPAAQASVLAVNASVRRFVSAKFPMLQMNGVGGGTTVEIEDATI